MGARCQSTEDIDKSRMLSLSRCRQAALCTCQTMLKRSVITSNGDVAYVPRSLVTTSDMMRKKVAEQNEKMRSVQFFMPPCTTICGIVNKRKRVYRLFFNVHPIVAREECDFRDCQYGCVYAIFVTTGEARWLNGHPIFVRPNETVVERNQKVSKNNKSPRKKQKSKNQK